MDDPHRSRYGAFDYAAATHAHRRRFLRHAHRRRFEIALSLLEPRPGDRVLDFGCGDGFFLALLEERGPRGLDLAGYEPMDYLRETLSGRSARIVANPDDLAPRSFDRIACLEVLEHLTAEDLDAALDLLARLLAPGGILVVSAPIEIGLPALGKYLVTRLLTGADRRCTPGEVLRMTLGLPVARESGLAFLPHKGFDHRSLERTLNARFRVERRAFSPAPAFGPWVNSQVIWRMAGRGKK
ncbi:MAG: methyltransferase domain-containing protein [Candidatus Eisenbacteria bacterium]|nr:methyltransferase domain-containing protein [Candidatus Eisenbacteria bacterium]